VCVYVLCVCVCVCVYASALHWEAPVQFLVRLVVAKHAFRKRYPNIRMHKLLFMLDAEKEVCVYVCVCVCVWLYV